MKPPIVALYRCERCAHEWSGKPGPTQCPRCGHPYVKWTNYEATFGKDRPR